VLIVKMNINREEINSYAIEQLERISGEAAKNCYQCGNCTGGCPVSYEMEIAPSKIIRMLQIGKIEQVRAANSMWLCVGCLQCHSRCPKSVSVAAVLDALRQATFKSGADHVDVKEIPVSFLKNTPQQALVCGFRKFSS
jgi:heterodisulfide reductase subunit C